MQEITLEYLLNHHFEKTGLEKDRFTKPNASLRFSPNQLSQLPRSDNDKMTDLKIAMSDIQFNKKMSQSEFEVRTNILYNSFKKCVNSLNASNRRVSREMLAKFVVGMGLSYEEADTLFALESQPLSPEHVLLDAVVVHCIQNKYDISEFYETCGQVNLGVKMIV